MHQINSNIFQGIYSLRETEAVSKLKQLANHVGLYLGLIVYTAIGAKVSIHVGLYLGLIVYTAIGAKVGIHVGLYLGLIVYTATYRS